MKKQKPAPVPSEKKNPSGPLLPVSTPVALSVMLVLGVLIYSNSFDCSFHFDDAPNITGQPLIRNFPDFQSWWYIQSTRQLAFGSFALTYWIYGYDVWGWHLFNLVIHLATSLAVWRLAVLLFRTPAIRNLPVAAQASSLALAAGFLFVAHPLATQSVTYIVQRIAAQAALFYLLSIGLYVQARLTDIRRPTTWLLYLGAAMTGVAAILTKENAYTLPLAILLIEIYFFQTDNVKRLFSDKRLIIAAAGLILVFSRFVLINARQINFTLTLDTGEKINSHNYLLTQFSVIWKYIQLLFIPVGQSLDHQIAISEHFSNPETLIAFLGLILLFGSSLFLYKRNRLVSFGILWFFLTLSVESSFLPIADVIFEHRTYLPSFGFFIAVCAGLLYPAHQKYGRTALILLSVVVAAYSFLTHARNRVWKTDETLWSDAISKAPSIRPYINRGDYYYQQKDYTKAAADFNAALKINPNYARAYRNLGKLERDRGRTSAAVEALTRAINLKPDAVDAYVTRSDLYYKAGLHEKALADADKALSLEKNHLSACLNRSASLNALGRYAESLEASDLAISINPKNAETWYNRGNTYRSMSKTDSALVCFDKAIELDPGNYFYFNNRGITNRMRGETESAITDFTQALILAPDNLLVLMNRSVCYLDLKKWSEAAADLDKILAANPDYPGARQNRNYATQRLAGK
ncbi:MAG: tetratricopeptide repeat protein [Bacteroidota bacterium]